ncbi:MAG: N-acetylneuraminate synthase family protein [Rhodospirillaceae bacterium]|nr:N-acetylneuraminate synthase family protein [Rhodospirillaceae bacterium]
MPNPTIHRRSFTIGRRTVGDDQPVFMIAEAGVNHNGDTNLALKLVTAAQEARADAVKYQTFKAERLVVPTAPKAAYQLEVTSRDESQLDMLRALELDEAAYPGLIKACAAAGVEFMSTPYNVEDIEFLMRHNVPALKLASIHAAEPSFLKYAAQTQKPLIISTGMCTMTEVKRAVEVVRSAGNTNFVILQCTTNYPSPAHDANLRAMVTMRDQLGVLVGYSDHTQTDTSCIAAVALGACVVEKHLTLDKGMAGPDHSSSLETAELRAYVGRIRETEAALGKSTKSPSDIEARNIPGMRRGIATRRAIAKGAKITEADLTLMRPAAKVPAAAWDMVIGTYAAKDIPAGVHLMPGDFSMANGDF